MNSAVTIRNAEDRDVSAIFNLLSPHIKSGIVLSRDEENIRSNIDCFYVAECSGKICGCVAVRDFGGNLFEIRSLAVDDDYRRCGIGSMLVNRAVGDISERCKDNEWKTFTLTIHPDFFLKLGFKLVNYRFPEKIWADCEKCAKKDSCDEIALLITSEDGVNLQRV